MKLREGLKMKPLVILIIYDEDEKEKAFEIYNSIKKYYRLYHEYELTITTPMFEVSISHFKNQIIRKLPDIILLPENCEYIERQNEKPHETKLIQYNKDEEIKLWEQY